MHQNLVIKKANSQNRLATLLICLHAAAVLVLLLAATATPSWGASSGSVGMTSRATMTISVRVPPRINLARGGVVHLASAQFDGDTKPCAGSYGCGQNYRVKTSRGRTGHRILIVTPE